MNTQFPTEPACGRLMDIQIQSFIMTTYESKDMQGLFNKQSPDPCLFYTDL